MPYLPATARRRRGIASLEFVMVFPMLLVLVAMLFAIAMADLAKVKVVTQARESTWKNRAQAKPGSRLDWIKQDPMASKIPPLAHPARQNVSLGPFFRGQPQQARSMNTLVANPWASEAIPFPSLHRNMYPHTSVLTDLPLADKQPLQDLLEFGFTLIADSCPNSNILP